MHIELVERGPQRVEQARGLAVVVRRRCFDERHAARRRSAETVATTRELLMRAQAASGRSRLGPSVVHTVDPATSIGTRLVDG